MSKDDLVKTLDSIVDSARSVINQRGKQLYHQGKVSLVEKEFPFFKFRVIGNSAPYYEIMLSLETQKNRSSYTCNCPYAENGLLCKHVIGAAYFLKNTCEESFMNTDKKTKKSKVTKEKKKTLKQPIALTYRNEDKFDLKTIFKPIQSNRRRDENNEFVLESIELTPNLLIAQLESVSNDYYFGETADVTVKIEFKDGLYLMSCSDDSHKGNCDHLKEVANYILSQKNVNFLEMIDEEKFDVHAHNFFSSIGLEILEGEKPSDLICFKTTKQEMYVEKIGRLKGLMNLDRLGDFLDEALIDRLADNKEKSLIPREEPKTDSDLPALVWDLDNYDLQILEVIPIAGKSNKTRDKITSYIRRIDSLFIGSFEAADSFVATMSAKEKLNNLLSQGEKDGVELWQSLDELFEQSQSMLHYIRYSPNGERRHEYSWDQDIPKKSEINLLLSIHHRVSVKFKLYEEKGLYVFELNLELQEGSSLNLVHDEVELYGGYLLLVNKKRLLLLNSPKETFAFQSFYPECILKCTPTELPKLMERVVQPIAKEFPVDFEQSGLVTEDQDLIMQQKRLYISELNGFVILKPVVSYHGGHEVNLLDDNTEMVVDGARKVIILQRNKEGEQEFLEQLAGLHDSFQTRTQQSYFFLPYKKFIKGHWFLTAFEKLKNFNVSVFGLEKLKSLKFSPYKPSIKLGMKSGQDWFEAEVDIAFGDNKVTISQLKKAVISGGGYVELKDGSLGVLPEEWLEKFSKIFRTAAIQKENVRIAKTHFNIIEDLVDEELSPQVYAEIQEKKERLSNFNGIKKIKQPKMLKATLRDYQQEGLNWLGFLRAYNWGGILADDMGLGKTLQALGLITMEIEKKPKKTNLVIAPTTLLFNWKNEIEKFAPEIDYVIHHGDRKSDIKELKKHHLVLTSYGVAVNDLELLKKLNFNLIVIDESQAIKNLNSKRYKAVCSLKGDLRIAMSGTPIENNIYELYAQMNFVNPDFFMGLTAFKNDYANVIERNNNPEINNELRNKTRPFVLRRTKEQVLTELPDKTEAYLYCEMNTAQRKVYDATRNEYRNYLMKKFEEEGVEKSQMYVLEGLTRLRQVCDSPLLIDKEGYAEKSSAKLDELVKHVLEKTGSHKILIFSQFVKMLQLIKEKFDEYGIVYEYLDGKTTVKQREKCVNRFQSDDNCRSFLISLKAGGTGLNLTSADYVYIVDPWWNPATENQAIDRCYRMGQTKKVMAYRMICKGTVEEKIIELQNKKKALSDDIVGAGGLKNLGREDIEALFS